MAKHARYTTPVKPAVEHEEPITPKRMGFDPLRPVRHVGSFINGTIHGTLNGMSNWGRRGMVVGLAGSLAYWFTAGAAVTMTAPFSGVIILGAVGGIVGGALLGAAIGVVTGGIHHLRHAEKREQMADTMAKNMEPARAISNGPTAEQAYRAQKRAEAINYARNQVQENEVAAEERRYWREQEMERRHHHQAEHHEGHGHGF